MQASPAPARGNNQSQQPPVARQGSSRARSRASDARYRRLIPDLRPGEKVVTIERRHPIVLLGKLIGPVLLTLFWLVGLFFVLPLLSGPAPDPLLSPNSGPPPWLRTLLLVAWFCLPLVLLLWASFILLAWSGQWTAITTHRLILMDKVLFLRETRREAPLAKVQNVVADYPNALGMSLDFGNLSVDTAGVGVLVSKDLPHPKTLRESIFAQQAALKATEASPDERRKAAIESILLGGSPVQSGAGPSKQARQPAVPTNVSTYSVFDMIFPFSPRRDGTGVIWHKHWFFLLRGVAWPVLLFGTALTGWLIALVSGERQGITTVESIMGWAALILFPICTFWALWKWEDWRNDLYKLDHERVYHIESLPFGLREQSKETLVTRITDVSYIVPSLLANLLNYGDVVIKTPGESTEFIFSKIPCPREVQQEIMTRLDEYRLKESAGVDREIEAWIRTYHDVTGKP
jgi:hypothetical protein